MWGYICPYYHRGTFFEPMEKENIMFKPNESKKRPFDIKRVIFNEPATIVLWEDGTKTVVKCGENDEYDPEKGLAMAISKKALGNVGHYYETFKKYLDEYHEEEELNSETRSYVYDCIVEAFKNFMTTGPITEEKE